MPSTRPRPPRPSPSTRHHKTRRTRQRGGYRQVGRAGMRVDTWPMRRSSSQTRRVSGLAFRLRSRGRHGNGPPCMALLRQRVGRPRSSDGHEPGVVGKAQRTILGPTCVTSLSGFPATPTTASKSCCRTADRSPPPVRRTTRGSSRRRHRVTGGPRRRSTAAEAGG